MGEGKFGTPRDLIIKKVNPPEHGTFDNVFFAWGNMFEQVANDVYAKMHGVVVHEFGLLRHPSVPYFAASPDGISEQGIMLEIKCPLKRKIVPGGPVPTQYFYQIQGQLDVCDLDECDYFECEFILCKSIWEFEASSDVKGIFAKMNDGTYTYGPLVLNDTEDLSDIRSFAEDHTSGLHYWIMKKYNKVRVVRDKAFIKEKLLELKDIWDKIVYYRDHTDMFNVQIMQELTIETEPMNVTLPKCAFIQ